MDSLIKNEIVTKNEIEYKMRKLLLGFALISISVQAQDLRGDIYNDSTEFVMVEDTVIDTAAISNFANQYRESLKKELDTLHIVHEVLTQIRDHAGKDFPEDMLGKYKFFLEWFKTNSCKGGDVYQYGGDGQSVSVDFDKIHKQLEKNKISKQIVELAPRIRYSGRMKLLEYDMNRDDFDIYKRVKNTTTKLPQKKALVSIPNIYYRPRVFMETRDGVLGKNVNLGTIEFNMLDRGWEWLKKENSTHHKNTYPVEYYSQTYTSHPEYIIRVIGIDNVHYVFDKTGDLVFTAGIYRSPHGEVNDLRNHLILLECKKDYEANKYDVASEGPDVQYAIKYQLGYFSDEEKKAKPQYSFNNKTASKYVEQLKNDHSEEYKYLYEIKRIGNNSFRYRYVDYEMKPTHDVYVTYYKTDPFFVGKRIDKIVTY